MGRPDGGVNGEISERALATLRRQAIEYRMTTFGSFFESTPEGLWHADQRRLDDDLLRRVDRVQWEMQRDFSRAVDWEVLYGPGSTPPPRTPDMVDGLTPERFYEREFA